MLTLHKFYQQMFSCIKRQV